MTQTLTSTTFHQPTVAADAITTCTTCKQNIARQNGGSALWIDSNGQTSCSAPVKVSPVQKRLDFITEVSKPVNGRALAILAAKQVGMDLPDLTTEEFVAVAEKMATEGPAFGKTTRWKSACAWARREIQDAKQFGLLDAELARWAVVQGSVWLCHAAD